MRSTPGRPSDDSLRDRALEILKRYGWNATSFQGLEPDFRYWFLDDDAFVAYVDTGRAWIAAGGPVCAEPRLAEVAQAFIAAGQRAGRRVCFFAVETRFTDATQLPALLIGEQPTWDPGRWAETVKTSRSLREQLRRAQNKGVTVRSVGGDELAQDTPLRGQLEALIHRWLGTRAMAPMGFLVQLHPFSHALERRYFVAEREGEVVGFLAAVPVYARGGWLLEDLLRAPDAPNGTAELLTDAAMRTLAEARSSYATLGLVPLAGAVTGWLRAARRGTSRLYDFRGLQAFKAKLKPERWDPIYLAFPEDRFSISALYDALAAFARGGILRFGLETLRRGPSLVVELLTLLLIPWTALLALAPAERWFPSPAVKWGWVLFDVALAVGLMRLARRWRHGLATLLAVMTTVDALLTWAQVLTFNGPRAQSALEWAVLAVSVSGPTLAAAWLWTTRDHPSSPRA